MGSNVIDYFVFDFALVPEHALNYQIINGTFFGSKVTFTVSFDVACIPDSYGPYCIYCLAADSDDSGHYTCLSDGSKQCLPGYVNESTNCTMCELAAGCGKSTTYTLQKCKGHFNARWVISVASVQRVLQCPCIRVISTHSQLQMLL